jgi:5-methylthioadenosine/S-adenosylhomocysteine deaminase
MRSSAQRTPVEAVFIAGKPVKFGGRLLDDALVARAKRVASESRDHLFQKIGFVRT